MGYYMADRMRVLAYCLGIHEAKSGTQTFCLPDYGVKPTRRSKS
jgi:hypothetical protein